MCQGRGRVRVSVTSLGRSLSLKQVAALEHGLGRLFSLFSQ